MSKEQGSHHGVSSGKEGEHPHVSTQHDITLFEGQRINLGHREFKGGNLFADLGETVVDYAGWVYEVSYFMRSLRPAPATGHHRVTVLLSLQSTVLGRIRLTVTRYHDLVREVERAAKG